MFSYIYIFMFLYIDNFDMYSYIYTLMCIRIYPIIITFVCLGSLASIISFVLNVHVAAASEPSYHRSRLRHGQRVGADCDSSSGVRKASSECSENSRLPTRLRSANTKTVAEPNKAVDAVVVEPKRVDII